MDQQIGQQNESFHSIRASRQSMHQQTINRRSKSRLQKRCVTESPERNIRHVNDHRSTQVLDTPQIHQSRHHNHKSHVLHQMAHQDIEREMYQKYISSPVDSMQQTLQSGEDNRGRRHGGNKSSNKKISSSQAKKNFPSDFFGKRNSSRCSANQRIETEQSVDRNSVCSNRQFQDSKGFQKYHHAKQLSQLQLPTIGRNQSAPLLIQHSLKGSVVHDSITSLNNQRLQHLQSQQQSIKKHKLRSSLQVQDNYYNEPEYAQQYLYNQTQMDPLLQASLDVGTPIMQQMAKLKQNCDKIIFQNTFQNETQEMTVDDSLAYRNLQYDKRKMSQPERSQRLEPLKYSMTKQYEEYRQNANNPNKNFPHMLPSLQSTRRSLSPLQQDLDYRNYQESPLTKVYENVNVELNNSLESSSKLLPYQEPLQQFNQHYTMSDAGAQQLLYHLQNTQGMQLSATQPQINLVPGTPFFNPLKQSVESMVSLMSTGTIGSININNVQSIHIHNGTNGSSMQIPNQQIINQFQNQNMQSAQTIKLDQKYQHINPKTVQKHQRYGSNQDKHNYQTQRSLSKDKKQLINQDEKNQFFKFKQQYQSHQLQAQPPTKTKRSLITIQGNHDQMMSTIQQQPEQSPIFLEQMHIIHEKRQEISTPQFNEPRQTLHSFNKNQQQVLSPAKQKKLILPNSSGQQMRLPSGIDKLEKKDFLKRISSQQAFFENATESSHLEFKSSQGSSRPSQLSQQSTGQQNSSFGVDKGSQHQISEKQKAVTKKRKVVLMHQLNSANTSGSRSGFTSSKTSNRPSKTSNNEGGERNSNNDNSDNVFEKAALVLQYYSNKEHLPPKPHVTFCNPQKNDNE